MHVFMCVCMFMYVVFTCLSGTRDVDHHGIFKAKEHLNTRNSVDGFYTITVFGEDHLEKYPPNPWNVLEDLARDAFDSTANTTH